MRDFEYLNFFRLFVFNCCLVKLGGCFSNVVVIFRNIYLREKILDCLFCWVLLMVLGLVYLSVLGVGFFECWLVLKCFDKLKLVNMGRRKLLMIIFLGLIFLCWIWMLFLWRNVMVCDKYLKYVCRVVLFFGLWLLMMWFMKKWRLYCVGGYMVMFSMCFLICWLILIVLIFVFCCFFILVEM